MIKKKKWCITQGNGPPSSWWFEFATAGRPRGFSGMRQIISSAWDSHTTKKSKTGIQTHLNCKLSILNIELLFLQLTFTKEQDELGFSYWDFPVLLCQMRDPSGVSGFHGPQVKAFGPKRKLKPWPGVIGSYPKKTAAPDPRWNSLILSSFILAPGDFYFLSFKLRNLLL